MADVLIDSPATIDAITRGFLSVGNKRHEAKEAMRQAVDAQSARIVEFAEVLSQADAACFNAKEFGGDRISIAGVAGGAAADPTSGMRWTVRIREDWVRDWLERRRR